MLYNFTVDEVLLKRKHSFTHLQNFEMLLAICEKNWQFLHQLATILGPGAKLQSNHHHQRTNIQFFLPRITYGNYVLSCCIEMINH